MIELGEFYKARSAGNPPPYLLPLFFKLSIKDLDEQSIEKRWMPTGKKFADVDKRIDLGLWKRGVKALLGTNGLIFEQAKPLEIPSTGIVYRSEVSYRNAVREEILKRSPPDLLYGSPSTVVGYERLCRMLSRQFVEDENGLLLLGLYGMPGLGKTTMSKALCDYFRTAFGTTRVCLVELSNVPTIPTSLPDENLRMREENSKHEMQVLKHLKEVLKKLWCLENDVLNEISDKDQARNLMRDLLQRDNEMDQQPVPVLLVIDNVGNDYQSYEEARAYLEAGFPPGSRIMFTSRGHNTVESLLPDASFCKPVPGLTDEEAQKVLLSIAAPGMSVYTLTDADSKRILGLCVNQCRFSVDGAFRSDAQYHPLALKALANFCRSNKFSKRSLSSWEGDLKAFDRRSSPSLFDILLLQYQGMNRDLERLIFLDIALFGREWYLTGGSDWWSWLAQLHTTESKSVESVVRQLEEYGIIYRNKALTMHQLSREFAVWFVTRDRADEKEWCVRVSDPPYIEITRVRMINLKGGIPEIRMEDWKFPEKLVLLQLHSCTDIEKLNLKKIPRLRHLELINLTKLKALIFAPEGNLLRFVWLSGLDSLQHLPDFNTCCPNLQVIITRCMTMNGPVGRITECKELKSLHVDTGLYQALRAEVGTSLGSNLMKLEISNLKQASEPEYVLNLEGLGRCDNLEWLILKDLPVRRISGLEQVKSLQRFGGRAIFYNCGNLEQAPEGVSEIHNVYKFTPDAYVWTSHQWEEGTNRAAVTSHYVNRWGRDEDFCDYGDVPMYWIHQPRWNMNSNIW